MTRARPVATHGNEDNMPCVADITLKPRVIIADDHQIFAAGLERLLSSECDVVAIVSDSDTLLERVRTLAPDIVTLDLNMPSLNGIEAVAEIHRIDPRVHVIIVTVSEDPLTAAELLRHGAAAYVLKNSQVTELLDAIRAVRERRGYVAQQLADAVLHSLMTSDARLGTDLTLTERQRQVLRLLAEGKSMKEVAATLNLTARTVAFHKYRIMAQLKIRSTAQLVRFAVQTHIV